MTENKETSNNQKNNSKIEDLLKNDPQVQGVIKDLQNIEVSDLQKAQNLEKPTELENKEKNNQKKDNQNQR